MLFQDHRCFTPWDPTVITATGHLAIDEWMLVLCRVNSHPVIQVFTQFLLIGRLLPPGCSAGPSQVSSLPQALTPGLRLRLEPESPLQISHRPVHPDSFLSLFSFLFTIYVATLTLGAACGILGFTAAHRIF